MSMRKWMLWVALGLMACNGRLSVNRDDGGAGGTAGATAGSLHGGGAGRTPVEIEGGSAGKLEGRGGELEHSAGIGGNPFPGYGGDGYIPIVGGWSGYATAGAGGAFVPPVPGEIGQSCIPGGLVTEADGSPAKAVIKTLDRCNEGLACNAQGKCVPAPDCPDSGLCVLRRAELAESGGVGGAPWVSMGSAGAGFAGAGNPWPTPNARPEAGVMALTASESHVYWVEYGTRDALGNYQHDGALMSYAIADGTTTVLASGLPGPVALGLTTTHIYVYVDGAPLISTPTHPQLLRVPLVGGNATLVQDGALPFGFVAVGSRAFWAISDELYSMASDPSAVASKFVTGFWKSLSADATDLYYISGSNEFVHTPATSAAPVPVGVPSSRYALHDDSIYTLEWVNNGALLSRAPKSGGVYQRVRALGAGNPSGLRVVGDRYFLDVDTSPIPDSTDSSGAYTSKRQVLNAAFVGTDPPIRLLERIHRNSFVDQLWVGTAGALYWSEGQAIYRQPVPTP